MALLFGSPQVSAADSFPAPKSLGELAGRGASIQRTMRLLATSTPQQRHTVRVLFYGQSITEQRWSQAVIADLRARFPHANLVVENRALGGFAAQMLVKSAETDLYPFQPDLVIFHVFGAHDRYEDILRRIRERTTAEILQQNDHLRATDRIDEATDPAKNPQDPQNWSGFMNFVWLPRLARTYGTEFVDQRSAWKRYLIDYGYAPSALLRDAVHLNAHGEFLMAEIVKSHLRYDPALGPSPAEQWVLTHPVGEELRWHGRRLRLRFVGTRIDALFRAADVRAVGEARVTIDGRPPSEFPELYGFTRALSTPGGKWPVIAPITSRTTRLIEDWTMEVRREPTAANLYSFTLTGSKTGPDGAGRSDLAFVSNSGRVAIAPDAWNIAYALKLPKIDPVPETFTVRWRDVPHFVSQLDGAALADLPQEPGVERAITLAQGLAHGEHMIEIEADPAFPLAALRVFTPPLRPEKTSR